jgi:ribosome maturation factor RimP
MLEDTIKEIAEPIFEEHQADIVKVTITGGDKYKTLQILAEGQDGSNLSIDILGKISREVSYNFDAENIIDGKYNLEVSSPGLDRPLVKISDYERFKDFLIKVKLKTSMEIFEGQYTKKFKGRVRNIDSQSNNIELELTSPVKIDGKKTEGEILKLDIEDIDSANIEITDTLIKEKGKMN